MNYQENAKAIESEIEKLESVHWDWFEIKHKDFWANAKEISGLFKTLKISKEDREKLWYRFNTFCEKIKREQNEKNESRRLKSDEHRKDIIREAERARPCYLFGFDPPDVEEMKVLGKHLKEAGHMLSESKTEMFGEHKQECFERIKEIREIHDGWWEEKKKNSFEKYLSFQARVKANLERNYERKEKAANTLEKLRAHTDDLRNKISSAWSDGFREQASGWLSEEEEKIDNIENYLLEIERWIEEDEAKLTD